MAVTNCLYVVQTATLVTWTGKILPGSHWEVSSLSVIGYQDLFKCSKFCNKIANGSKEMHDSLFIHEIDFA